MTRDERERAIVPFVIKLIQDFRILQQHPCVSDDQKKVLRQRMPWLITPETADAKR